jgi:hypothetical protein
MKKIIFTSSAYRSFFFFYSQWIWVFQELLWFGFAVPLDFFLVRFMRTVFIFLWIPNPRGLLHFLLLFWIFPFYCPRQILCSCFPSSHFGFSSVSSLLRQGSARSVFLLRLSVTRLSTGQGHRIRPGLRFGWISSTLIFVRHLFMFHLPASSCSPPVCKRCHPFYCCSFWPPSVGAGQASALDHLCSLLCVGIVAPDQITLPRWFFERVHQMFGEITVRI